MYKQIVFFYNILIRSFLRYIHLDKLMHSGLSPHIYTHQLMSVDLIVKQVQYTYLDCHHHILPLSLSCRIMFRATQKHH